MQDSSNFKILPDWTLSAGTSRISAEFEWPYFV